MAKRHKKNRNKNPPSNDVPSVGNQYELLRAKNRKQSKSEKVEEPDTPSKTLIPVSFKDMKVVAYRDLFPNKIKTGTEILAALKRYDFSKQKEEMKPEDNDSDELCSEDDVPKRHYKQIKPQKGKLKGFSLPRDPVFHLRYAPGPPNDLWYPPVPGLDAPLGDACEVIGNLNKPWPRDPEEEARLDKLPMPTEHDIHKQFTTSQQLVPSPPAPQWKPGEMEEVIRTRTTMADLKHFYETGELIVRE